MGPEVWYESLGSNTSLQRQEAGRDAPEGVGPAMHTAFWVRVKAMEKDARGAQKSMDHRRIIIENTFDKDKADKALDWWFLYWFVWGDSDFPWFSLRFSAGFWHQITLDSRGLTVRSSAEFGDLFNPSLVDSNTEPESNWFSTVLSNSPIWLSLHCVLCRLRVCKV